MTNEIGTTNDTSFRYGMFVTSEQLTSEQLSKWQMNNSKQICYNSSTDKWTTQNKFLTIHQLTNEQLKTNFSTTEEMTNEQLKTNLRQFINWQMNNSKQIFRQVKNRQINYLQQICDNWTNDKWTTQNKFATIHQLTNELLKTNLPQMKNSQMKKLKQIIQKLG
jgi:hypothetical protein